VEEGVIFNGNCRIVHERKGKPAERPTPEPEIVPEHPAGSAGEKPIRVEEADRKPVPASR
jgi:hypothetical protein